MSVKNKVQLITYSDSLGGNLSELKKVLEMHFPGLFEGGIHLLPPFPSSGDRGFAPLTYFEIDPAHGTWEDVRALAEGQGILLDLMVNHISSRSPLVKAYLEKGVDSSYENYFIPTEKLWPDGIPVQEDIDQMVLRREKPYSEFTIEETGEKKLLWTTFGRETPSEQIDLDTQAPEVREMFSNILKFFSKNGVTMVRLDAVGYVVKKLGTSCFFVEPEIYEFLHWINGEADKFGIILLPEVHAQYDIQTRLSQQGFWTYDFILPYTVLDVLLRRDSRLLYAALKDRPLKQFTTLDCHDGIPVKPDLDGLVTAAEAREICSVCENRGASFSRVVSEKHRGEGGFDVHQILGTFYSLLNGDDDAYIAARAIQFFVPGIPQVYYVGLLAGENDPEAVERTGEGREINRHNFTSGEVALQVKKPVVQRLKSLIAFRNSHPAFEGTFTPTQKGSSRVCLEWHREEAVCVLKVDLEGMKSKIISIVEGRKEEISI